MEGERTAIGGFVAVSGPDWPSCKSVLLELPGLTSLNREPAARAATHLRPAPPVTGGVSLVWRFYFLKADKGEPSSLLYV